MRKRSIATLHDESALKERFGVVVRIFRQRLGISQEELAWRAQIHRTYLADIERGGRNVTLSSIDRLVKALGVSLAEFFFALEDYFQSPIETAVSPKKTTTTLLLKARYPGKKTRARGRRR